MYQDVQGGGCLSWFDIIKKPLISIPKGSVRIKKPKKIETKEECLPKIKKWLGDVSRIIANESDFTIFFEKDGGHCYVQDFNISEEYACNILQAMSMNSPPGGFMSSWFEGNVAYLDSNLTDDELMHVRNTPVSHDMALMKITNPPYNCEINYVGAKPLTSERWSEILDKIKDVMP